jgi:hypothetical protein
MMMILLSPMLEKSTIDRTNETLNSSLHENVCGSVTLVNMVLVDSFIKNDGN